jgi:hypothetical protein
MDVVEFRLGHGGEGFREGFPGVAQQGEMVVAVIGGIEKVGLMGEPVSGQKIHDPDVVAGETGQNLFFRIEELHAGPVVRQAETDESVMDKAMEIRLDYVEEFLRRQVRGVVHGRNRILAVILFVLLEILIEFKNEKGFLRKTGGEGAKDISHSGGIGQRGETVGIGAVLQKGKGITFPKAVLPGTQFALPQANAEGVLEGFVDQGQVPLDPAAQEATSSGPQRQRYEGTSICR